MTLKQAEELCARAGALPPAGSSTELREKVKGTIRKVVDGIEFRSTLEANAYQLLRLWELAGCISDLKVQPKFVLQEKQKGMRKITYTADFNYLRNVAAPGFVRCMRLVVIDAKGFKMEVYRIKAKLFRAKYPDIEFQEWTRETLKQHLAAPVGFRLRGLAPESRA